jgi:prophage regulatory protein
VGDLGEFVGSGELEQMFGVSRQRVYQLTTRKDFPAPAIVAKGGRIWRTADVVAWAEEKGREIHE